MRIIIILAGRWGIHHIPWAGNTAYSVDGIYTPHHEVTGVGILLPILASICAINQHICLALHIQNHLSVGTTPPGTHLNHPP